MRILWLCNLAPGLVRGNTGGLWMDHVLGDLQKRSDMTIHILYRGEEAPGERNGVTYAAFREPKPQIYMPELETRFAETLKAFQPDVIHIWGTEYGHTLAMVNAAEKAGRLNTVVVSIQGLCSVIARHYLEGIPCAVRKRWTFRDLLRRDNLLCQAKTFARRGELERQALGKVRHILGRTQWDMACTYAINPQRVYHPCGETLREEFYGDVWRYETCRKHRIFASSADYPVKGFHYLLEAFRDVLKDYPDATLAVAGNSFFTVSPLRRTSYQSYLAELATEYGVADKVEFLGSLSAREMKRAYLEANVFALSSTIENSPNSLGEAMLLGVPSVAADVGGVADMMDHGKEGYICQPTAPYMLAHHICRIFRMEEDAENLGSAARAHAQKTHDPENNLAALLRIYEEVIGEAGRN